MMIVIEPDGPDIAVETALVPGRYRARPMQPPYLPIRNGMMFDSSPRRPPGEPPHPPRGPGDPPPKPPGPPKRPPDPKRRKPGDPPRKPPKPPKPPQHEPGVAPRRR